MQKYVALLRGINVGGNNKIEMKKLKTVFETLGFTDVSTYINSGNVIFSTDKKEDLPEEIENALKKNFGFVVPVVIRDAKNIAKVCKAIPQEWTNDTDTKTDVLFLWDEHDSKKTIDLITKNPEVDTLLYVSGAIAWSVKRINYTKSGRKKFIGTKVYKGMTARNVNTVRKLNQLLF
jgi:uncharacterized protein (DUF1697 family)